MTIFGQMFLNRDIYGDARILSSASVDAIARNQIPVICAKYKGSIFQEALWVLGWNVCGNKKIFRLFRNAAIIRSFIAYCYSYTDEVKQSEFFKHYLDTMSRFWKYSYHNQLLIFYQKPEATTQTYIIFVQLLSFTLLQKDEPG